MNHGMKVLLIVCLLALVAAAVSPLLTAPVEAKKCTPGPGCTSQPLCMKPTDRGAAPRIAGPRLPGQPVVQPRDLK